MRTVVPIRWGCRDLIARVSVEDSLSHVLRLLQRLVHWVTSGLEMQPPGLLHRGRGQVNHNLRRQCHTCVCDGIIRF